MDIIEKCELCKNNIYFPVNKYCCLTCENIQHFLNKQLYKNLSKLKKNPNPKVKLKNELKPNKVKPNKVKPNRQTSLLPPISNIDHCSVKIRWHTKSIIIGVRE